LSPAMKNDEHTPNWMKWIFGILICYSFCLTILTLVLIKKLLYSSPKTLAESVIPLAPHVSVRPLPFTSIPRPMPVPQPRLRSFPTPSPDPLPTHLSPSTTFHSPMTFPSPSTSSFVSSPSPVFATPS
jgi:hypothetical protein